MKYFLLCLLMMMLLPAAIVKAEEAKRSVHKTCVYKYLTCRDNCEYHQDESSIRPCKANCDRKYSCRPKKTSLPTKQKSSLLGQAQPG